VFALDLMSTYEREHTIFGLLGQANLTQKDVLTVSFLSLQDCLPEKTTIKESRKMCFVLVLVSSTKHKKAHMQGECD
jgi:hypothetical protein